MSAIKAPASSHFSWHHDLNNTYQVHGSCVGGRTFLHERLIDDSIHSEPNPQRGLTLNTQIDQRAHPCSRHTRISTIVLSVLTFVRHHHQKFPCEWITLACQRISLLYETSLPYYCTQFYLPSVSNCSFYNATGRPANKFNTMDYR